MSFKKLTQSGSNFLINNSRGFARTCDLGDYVPRVFDFAFGMTFGNAGEHRNHRTGGQAGRKNGELFINTFQGKLAEFGIHQYLRANDIITAEPDLGMWALGRWDDSDLVVNGIKINVKSAAHFSNLLLLETGDWTGDGLYIPNNQTEQEAYSFFILSRIKPDGKKLMRDNRLMFSNTVEEQTLRNIITEQRWEFDIAGFINRDELRELIRLQYILPQNSLLNGKTSMDAENYYCQSGDMHPIGDIIPLLNPL